MAVLDTAIFFLGSKKMPASSAGKMRGRVSRDQGWSARLSRQRSLTLSSIAATVIRAMPKIYRRPKGSPDQRAELMAAALISVM